MQDRNSIFSRLEVKKYIFKKNFKHDLPASYRRVSGRASTYV